MHSKQSSTNESFSENGLPLPSHTVSVDLSQTHGALADAFLEGRKFAAFLGISPGSYAAKAGKLRALLEWLLSRATSVTVIEGSFLARWDLVALGKSPDLSAATAEASRKADLAGVRIHDAIASLGAADKVRLLDWRALVSDSSFREILGVIKDYSAGSPKFARSIRSTTEDFRDRLRQRGSKFAVQDAQRYLDEYVFEELAVFLYLHANAGISIEVYPGSDLPLMEDIAAGAFPNFPLAIPKRTHIGVVVRPSHVRVGSAADIQGIRELVMSWPTHFVPSALPLIEADCASGRTLVWKEGSQLCGFAVWDTTGIELELKWIAVSPQFVGRGIGSALVTAVLSAATTETSAILYTATTDSKIAGTDFQGELYAATHQFFYQRGFRLVRRLDSHWSPTNHALLLRKDL